MVHSTCSYRPPLPFYIYQRSSEGDRGGFSAIFRIDHFCNYDHDYDLHQLQLYFRYNVGTGRRRLAIYVAMVH